MTSNEIRSKFQDFFRSKQHHIVSSAPMVVKNDPTLMFTNAGMNQFKEIFLGNAPVTYPNHSTITVYINYMNNLQYKHCIQYNPE